MGSSSLLALFFVGGIGLSLVGCVTPPESGGTRMVISTDVTKVKMPVLRSAYFEEEWGKPELQIGEDGSYFLRYRQGETLNFFFVRGLAKMEPAPVKPPDWEEPSADPEGPAPPVHSQTWNHAMIMGQRVKWYQADGGSGADFPGFQTVDFQLTAPDGRTGFYRIEVTSDSKKKVADWIGRVSW